MKAFKRNAVIITILLFVCAAVYLNWSYNEKVDNAETAGENLEGQTEQTSTQTQSGTEAEEQDTQDQQSSGDDAGLFYTGEDIATTSKSSSDIAEYFAQVRLERQQARDEASMTLETVAATEGRHRILLTRPLQR